MSYCPATFEGVREPNGAGEGRRQRLVRTPLWILRGTSSRFSQSSIGGGRKASDQGAPAERRRTSPVHYFLLRHSFVTSPSRHLAAAERVLIRRFPSYVNLGCLSLHPLKPDHCYPHAL